MPPTGMVQERVRTVLRFLRGTADLILLDIPCTFDEGYFETLAAADLVVLVGEQRIPSIRNVQLVLETFRRPGDRPEPRFVVNRYDPRLEGFTTSALAKFLKIQEVMPVANDPTGVANALNSGRPLREAAPRSPVLAHVEALARALLPATEASVARTPSTILGRLFRAFRFA